MPLYHHKVLICRTGQTLHEILWPFFELVHTMRTTAIVHVLPFKLYLSGKLHWFFSQAGWAHDQVADFIEIFPWVVNEDIHTALAAE